MKSVLLLLVFPGFILSPALASGKSDSLELKRINEREFRFLYYKGFSAEKTLQLSSKDLLTLAVESGAGNVEIKGYDADVIKVKADIVLSARSIGRAATIVEEFMDLSLEKLGSKALLKSHFDFHQRNNLSEAVNPNGFFSSPVRKIDLVVYVPKYLAVTVNDRSGDLFIEGIENDLTVRDRSGFLEIKNIKGNLKLKDSSGDIKLVNINTREEEKKRITISDRSGTIRLKGANADIELFDRSGDISIGKISGNISLTDASGHLFIEEIEGNLKLNDASGDIKATDINGNVTLSDNSGGVYVNHVTQSVHVKNAGTGDLQIRNYDGSISGDLRRLGR